MVTAANQAAQMLPDRLGNFRASSAASFDSIGYEAKTLEDFQVLSAATRFYTTSNGDRFSVTLIETRSDSAAYALLTNEAERLREMAALTSVKTGEVGTAGIVAPKQVAFFKGTTFVSIKGADGTLALAQNLAKTLDRGTGEIPVLVKHLPEWETAQQQAVYAVTSHKLQQATGNNTVLGVLSFDGGTEAVTTTYDGPTRLVIVEYTTPQFAADNNARIVERLQQLREQGGQSVPSAYRRVGNYLVFVFGAPDQTTAEKLIGQVKYQQVVSWLGDNPRLFEEIERAYTRTTAGMVLGAFKLAGVGIVLCLLTGSIIGGTLFMRRRAQASITENYSDAGGMVRLNIDDMLMRDASSNLLIEAESGSAALKKRARD